MSTNELSARGHVKKNSGASTSHQTRRLLTVFYISVLDLPFDFNTTQDGSAVNNDPLL